jgi:FkbM family methyltransferase
MRMIGFPSIRLAVSSLTDFKRRKAAVKEPETVEWLRDGFRRHGSFALIDIGANIGGYSLIACALDPGCRVVAVEPFPPTFRTLCRNIALNDLADRIVPVNGFFGTAAGPQTLTLAFDSWSSGLAEHKPTGRYRIALPIHDISAIRRHLPAEGPVLCKIDVDGGEMAVMAGLDGFLAEPRLKSVLIECDSADADAIGTLLRNNGLGVQSTYGKANQRQINLIASRD